MPEQDKEGQAFEPDVTAFAGRTAMRVGERFKDQKTGRVYTVGMIAEDAGIVLKGADGSQRIIVGQFKRLRLRDLARSFFALPLCILRPPAGGTTG